MPETLPGGQCRETPDHLARAIRCASDPTGAGSIPTAARPHRSCGHYRSLASPQSLVRGCRFFGPNPYLSPFNVFGPLTFCLIFGVHSTSPASESFPSPLNSATALVIVVRDIPVNFDNRVTPPRP